MSCWPAFFCWPGAARGGQASRDALSARDALAESFAKAQSELAVTKSALSAAQGELVALREQHAAFVDELAAKQDELDALLVNQGGDYTHELLLMVDRETAALSEQVLQMAKGLSADKSRAAEARLLSLFDGDPYYKADNITLSANGSVLTIGSVMSYADREFACLQALRTYKIWLRSLPDLVQAAVDRGCDTVVMPFFYPRERSHFDDSQVAFGEEALKDFLESTPRAPFCVLLIELSAGKVSFLGNLSISYMLSYYESPEDAVIFKPKH